MIYPEPNLNLKLPTHLMYVLVKNLGQNQSHQFQNQFLSSNSKLCNTIICSIFCPNTLIDNKEITSVLNDSWVFLGECRSENNPRFVTEGYNYYCFFLLRLFLLSYCFLSCCFYVNERPEFHRTIIFKRLEDASGFWILLMSLER